MRRTLAVVGALALGAGAASADPDPKGAGLVDSVPPELRAESLPPDLQERMNDAGLWNAYAIDGSINPYYLRGDFDGDKRTDYVLSLIAPGETDARIVMLRAKGKPVWFDGLDFPARDAWYVVDRKTKVGVGAAGGKPPKLRGDAIMIEKAESSSALVYWTGKGLATYWQGD
jgi:hypothetical protein